MTVLCGRVGGNDLWWKGQTNSCQSLGMPKLWQPALGRGRPARTSSRCGWCPARSTTAPDAAYRTPAQTPAPALLGRQARCRQTPACAPPAHRRAQLCMVPNLIAAALAAGRPSAATPLVIGLAQKIAQAPARSPVLSTIRDCLRVLRTCNRYTAPRCREPVTCSDLGHEPPLCSINSILHISCLLHA